MISHIQDLSRSYFPEPVASPKVGTSDEPFSAALTKETSSSTSQVSGTGGGIVQFFGGWTAAGASQPAAPAAPASEAPAPFVPRFQTNVQVVSAMGGSEPLNPAYFATRETAQYIADKFGTGEVLEVPYGGTGGPYVATANEFHIRLANGATVNAGLLADYYVRMPEAQFPGLADTMIQMAVARAEEQNG